MGKGYDLVPKIGCYRFFVEKKYYRYFDIIELQVLFYQLAPEKAPSEGKVTT